MSESKLRQAYAKKSVAILGTAPTVDRAPFADQGVEIWGCGISGFALPRCDVWFQLHDMDRLLRPGISSVAPPPHAKEMTDWLKGFRGTVFMHKEYPNIPGSEAFPFQPLVNEFGREFRCTAGWMFARAISLGYGTIGLYGVEMNATDEYAEQRPSMKFFEGWARAKGINVIIPEASSMSRCNFLYGMEDAKFSAFTEYKNMWKRREDEIRAAIEEKKLELARMQGVGEAMRMFEQDRM